MIRWLGYLILSLFALALLRNIIGMVMSALTGGETPVKRAAPGPPAAPKSEALVKDPVCGTFVASSSPWVRSKGGETYHFCSEACRDKFAA